MTRIRKPAAVRLADGAAWLRLLTLTGIATVLVTRAYLAATGYPKIGDGTIHIGHVLWGGLLMIVALAVALLRSGWRARAWIAVLGGVGAGLFVDEVGKYLTTTNDYFYRPAAAIIYLMFAGLLVAAAALDRTARPLPVGSRLAAAAQTAATGLVDGLTPAERERAVRLLDGCPPADRAAVERLLARAPHRDTGRLARLADSSRALLHRLTRLRRSDLVVLGLLAMSHLVVAIVFVSQAATGAPHSTDAGAITVSAVTRTAAAVLVLAALVRMGRARRAAYRLARAAILLDLLVTEVFNFHDSQFAAVAELPFLVFAYWYFREAEAGAGR